MRPIIALIGLLALAACVKGPAALSVPDFDDYAVDDFMAPEAVAPDLRAMTLTPMQAQAISEGAEKGVAFAGFYAVAQIPCGERCIQFAFIDGRNGQVGLGPKGSYGADFRHHSRLFVIDPPNLQPKGGQAPTRSYLWNGRTLVPLQS